MVKIITAENKHNCEHLLGEFSDPSHFDLVVDFDCDFYAPVPYGVENSEENIIFKFRKNYFTEEQLSCAYAGLREAATETQNRGIAAGPKTGKLGTREWVTQEEEDILNFLFKPHGTLDGSDPIQEIRNRHSGKKDVGNRGQVWKTSETRDKNFDFNAWVEETRNLPPEECSKAAKELVKTKISATSYGNSVFSGVAGFFDRYPRIPYLRATSYTEHNRQTFDKSLPFLQQLSKGFQDLLPVRYSNQKSACDKVDPKFIVEGTVFSTLTVNKSFRTAYHRDAGDLTSGFSNLCVITDGKSNYTGGYLVLPEFRVAVNIRPGDLLLINNHEGIHGNTPIVLETPEAERISLVAYFREGMLEGGSYEYETLRKEFVEFNKTDETDPNWRPMYNGVFPDMWNSEKWHEYLKNYGTEEMIQKYHPEFLKSSVDLDEFF